MAGACPARRFEVRAFAVARLALSLRDAIALSPFYTSQELRFSHRDSRDTKALRESNTAGYSVVN